MSDDFMPSRYTLAAEARAERDRALAELTAANDALADVTRLLDEAREERNEAREQIRLLLTAPGMAERDAARRVVEAAEAWLNHWRSPEAFMREPRAELIRLADAVDAYRAGQKAPADGPASTVGQDPVEVEAPSADTEQAQTPLQGAVRAIKEQLSGLGVQDDWETPCPVREDRTHCDHWYDNEGPCCDCGEGSTKPPTADPPGLDAAIEAARNAYRGVYIGIPASNFEFALKCAVRAALRAGASNREVAT